MTAPLHIYPYVLQFEPDQTNSTQTIHLLKWGGSILAVFTDGYEGWYQLWRPDEHFELM
jgi:hypothetical protein